MAETIMNGTDLIMMFGETTADQVIVCSTSNSITVNQDVKETTCKTTSATASKWVTKTPGKKSWSMSADGLYVHAPSSGKSFEDIVDIILDDKNPIKVFFGKATEVAGDVSYTGEAIMTSTTLTADDNADATFSASFEGVGALTKTVKA